MFKSKKIDKCDIQFENDRLVFYPGEKLRGKFILHMNRSMPMERIMVVCKGKTKTEWIVPYIDSETQEPKEREHKSKHKYFEKKKKIFGEDDNEKRDQDAGEHEFDFEFQLPKDIHSSIQHENGFIQYSVKVIIKKPWKKDLKLKKMFVVNQLHDANDQKYNFAPGEEDEKVLGCLCCASEPISLKAHINRSAFCPGDRIMVTAKCENKSDRDMEELEVELIQVLEFKAHNEDFGDSYRTLTNKVAEVESKKIKGGDELEWKNKLMDIPALPLTTNSKFIDVKYYVRVHLDIPMAIDMEFKLPITMCSVPFKPTYQDAPLERQTRFKPKAPEGIGYSDMDFLNHPDMWPFQFSQVKGDKPKKMNKKDDKEFADDFYIPVYTFAFPVEGMDNPHPPSQPSGGGSATSVKTNSSEMPPIE
eukprot:TCONS_00058159-protein